MSYEFMETVNQHIEEEKELERTRLCQEQALVQKARSFLAGTGLLVFVSVLAFLMETAH